MKGAYGAQLDGVGRGDWAAVRQAKAMFTTSGHANPILNTDKKRPVPHARNVGGEGNCVSKYKEKK